MTEPSDGVAEGLACLWCGIYFDVPHGYPVLCKECYRTSTPKEREGLQRATEKELG